jgi:threonine synthase
MEKLKGLKCRECGRHYPAAPVHVCEFCFGPLEVDYHYEAIRARMSRESIAAGPPSMWRYKELLPIEGEVAVGHHVGFTPLVRADNLAQELGCRELWIKNDSVCHPTWSFKDRVVTRKLIEAGVIPRKESVVICITGNGLKTPDALHERLQTQVKIKPSLSAFDRALADLKSHTR